MMWSCLNWERSSAGEEDQPGTKDIWEEDFYRFSFYWLTGFPGCSVSKESAYNSGDLGLIPWWGRSPGEGNGNPLQYLAWEIHGERNLASYSPWGHRVRHDWLTQFSSVAQSCLTLCSPVDCSTPGFPVHHQLLELTQTHVHWVGDAIQSSHSLLSPSHSAFNLSQHQGLFQWVRSLHQVAKLLEFQLQHQSFQWIFRTDFL